MKKRGKIKDIINKFSKNTLNSKELSAEDVYVSLIELVKSINVISKDSFLSFIIVRVGRKILKMKDLNPETCQYDKVSKEDFELLKGFMYLIMFGIAEFVTEFGEIKSPRRRTHNNIVEDLLENNPKELEELLKRQNVPKEHMN